MAKKKEKLNPYIDWDSYERAGKAFERFMNKNQKKKNG